MLVTLWSVYNIIFCKYCRRANRFERSDLSMYYVIMCRKEKPCKLFWSVLQSMCYTVIQVYVVVKLGARKVKNILHNGLSWTPPRVKKKCSKISFNFVALVSYEVFLVLNCQARSSLFRQNFESKYMYTCTCLTVLIGKITKSLLILR